jgi:hypothetical protein
MQEDEEEALTLAETGDLANVVLRNGRAIGTLGHEEEMRKLRTFDVVLERQGEPRHHRYVLK